MDIEKATVSQLLAEAQTLARDLETILQALDARLEDEGKAVAADHVSTALYELTGNSACSMLNKLTGRLHAKGSVIAELDDAEHALADDAQLNEVG